MLHKTDKQQNLLTGIFHFYLFSNLHMALCAVALTIATSMILGSAVQAEWLLVTGGGTLSLYCWQRWIGVKQMEKPDYLSVRHQWNYSNQRILLLLTIAGLIPAGYGSWQLNPAAWVILALTFLLAFLYSAPLWKNNGRRFRLRDITGLKIGFIAVTWTLVCVWIPFADIFPDVRHGQSFENAVIWSVVCFMFLFALTIPFDVRDMEFDSGTLKSMPMILGEKRTVRIAVVILLLSMPVIFLVQTTAVTDRLPISPLRWAYVLWALVAAVVVAFTNNRRSEYFFSFLIDGLLILLPVFLMIVSEIFS